MALHPEADGAIEDVVNEAIVSDLYDSPVEIELSNLNAGDSLHAWHGRDTVPPRPVGESHLVRAAAHRGPRGAWRARVSE